MTHLVYDNSFEGFLTAVFITFSHRYQEVIISSQSNYLPTLFGEEVTIYTDLAQAKRVLTKIETTWGREGVSIFLKAFLSQEEKIENTTSLLDTKITENQPNKKSSFSSIKAYIWVITSAVLALFIIVLLYSDSLFKKSYQFCFTDADRGTAIQSTINIKVIKEKESPILYKVNPGECFYINTKDKTLRMEVSTPLYEKVEIFRNLEDAPEVEHIALKPDDYALMLYYYSTKDKDNSSLEHIKNRQQKLNHLISDNALIYQIFDNEIYGVETLSKQKYIGLVTTPTQSLRNLKVLDTQIENGKIIAIKFKIENNEKN